MGKLIATAIAVVALNGSTHIADPTAFRIPTRPVLCQRMVGASHHSMVMTICPKHH